MFRKFLKGFTLILVLFLTTTMVVHPASATPSDELNFNVNLIYAVPSSATTFGTWQSSGLLEKSGGLSETIHFAGWTEAGLSIKNILGTLLLSDADGTITLRSQIHEDFFDPSTGSLGTSGTWVILDGTGAYAGLRGQGTVNISAQISWCSTGVLGLCIIETRTYTGQGHFEP